MGGKKERVCLLKIDVMGVLFDNVTMDQALDRAEDLIKAKTGAYCVTPNEKLSGRPCIAALSGRY